MSRLRIGIDARLCWHGGIGRYVRNLVNHLLREDPDDTFVLLINPEAPPGVEPGGGPARAAARVYDWLAGGESCEVRAFSRPVPPLSFREQAYLPAFCRELGLDLLHVPHVNAPLTVRDRPIVVNVHDATYFHRSDSAQGPLRAAAARWLTRRAARTARLVITGTNASRDDIVATVGVDPARVRVIGHGADEFLDVQAAGAGCMEAPDFPEGIPFGFIAHVGNHRPHKGTDRLLAALALLRKREDDRVRFTKLVMAGPEDRFTARTRARCEQLGLKVGDAVRFVGEVSELQLRWIYASAKAVVLPSQQEGFGLPALEAGAAGVPLVASRVPAVHEVMGEDGAFWVDPQGSAEQLADAIATAITDVDARARVTRRARGRAMARRWFKVARQTLACYEEALGLREPGEAPPSEPADAPEQAPEAGEPIASSS